MGDADETWMQMLDEYVDKASAVQYVRKPSVGKHDHSQSTAIGKSWSSGQMTTTDRYIQTVIDYDQRGMTVKVSEEKLQAMLDDMREKMVQQILDEVSILIDEATRD